MQDKGLSFKPYWKKEKENFEKEGMQPSLDYPLFNDMINGMLFKSFDEILKSKDSSNMSYNPQKNKFLQNFKLYLNELKRDVSKVYQVIELELHRIQRNCNKYMATVTKPEGKTLAPKIEGLYNRLQLIAKFAQFNYDIYNHVIKKIGKQFVKLEIKFETEGFLVMMEDEVSNVFLGNLRTQECVARLQLLIKYAMNYLREINPEFEVLDDKIYHLKNLDDDIDMRRRKLIRLAPSERVESIINLFEEKKNEIVADVDSEVARAYGDSNGWKKDVFQSSKIPPYAESIRQDTDNQLVTPRDIQLMTPIAKVNPSLLSNGKPTGDDFPLELEDGVDPNKRNDEEDDEHIDPHRVRNIDRYFVDINSGFVVTAEACYSASAPWFVLVHTFMYMLTYYGITPTTYDYNLIMGIPKAYFGLVSAFTPFVAALSCFIYNLQTKVHYKASYMISIVCMIAATFLYSLAFTFRDLTTLFIGRALFGYGGARILTRKFFTREIHVDHRIKWSAILVGFTGMSMTFGPGLSALLETLIDSEEAHSIHLDDFKNWSAAEQDRVVDVLTSFKIGGMKFSKVNYVPMLTCCCFIIMLVCFILFFQDTPPKTAEEEEAEKKKDASASGLRYQISHIDNVHFLPQDKKSAKYGTQDKHKKLQEFKDKLSSVTKYFTDKQTYYICLYFFVIKAIQECIIVESPAYIIKNYKHTSALSGLIFFLFTFFTLPSALTPSFLKKKFEDRAMLRFASYLLIGAMIIKCQFSKALYPFGLFIVGSCSVLGLALAVETCCSSILTKVISEKKAKGFMNAGILAGLIDTLGRVTGSTSITIITAFADYSILDCILYPFWLLVFIGIVLGLIGMYSRLDMKMYVKFG